MGRVEQYQEAEIERRAGLRLRQIYSEERNILASPQQCPEVTSERLFVNALGTL
jgi:hypothetical protein